MSYIIEFLFYSIPIVTLLTLIVSLVLFLCAKIRNKRHPGSVNPRSVRFWMIMLIVSSAITATTIAIVIAFIALLYSALAYM